jgi:SHS2 domain-containing protein
MREHEILTDKDDRRLRVTASTRAGLTGAAVQGLFEAAGPKWQENEERAKSEEVAFEVSGDNFDDLLVRLLNEALRLAAERKLAFEEVRFALIIDTQAKGELIGRKISGYREPINKVTRLGLEVEKNERGVWETIVVLD